MDFKSFLSKDLSVIKKEISPKLISRKVYDSCDDDTMRSILTYCVDLPLDKLEFILDYILKYNPFILSRSSTNHNTHKEEEVTELEHFLYCCTEENLKFSLEFLLKRFPIIFSDPLFTLTRYRDFENFLVN